LNEFTIEWKIFWDLERYILTNKNFGRKDNLIVKLNSWPPPLGHFIGNKIGPTAGKIGILH
jgi:hypothetical protein